MVEHVAAADTIDSPQGINHIVMSRRYRLRDVARPHNSVATDSKYNRRVKE